MNCNFLSPFGCLTYTVQPAWPALPALCPARVRLFRVLLGQRPSLHNLLRPSLAFVRLLRRYYAAVRLPAAVHVGLIAHRFLPPSLRLCGCGRQQGLSVLVREVSMHAWGLRLRRACGALAFTRATVLPSGWPDTVGAPDFGYFGAHQLQGYPAYICPCPNASSAAFARAPSHGSGSGWFATPFLYDSFIHYFTPVYPDAIQATGLPHLLPLALTCVATVGVSRDAVPTAQSRFIMGMNESFMKLPNGEHAIVDIRKLLEYCLNSHHPRGRNKARVFASVGIREADAEELRTALLAAAVGAEAELGVANVYGQRFIVDFDLLRPGRGLRIRSTWIVRTGDNLPRLTSCYLL